MVFCDCVAAALLLLLMLFSPCQIDSICPKCLTVCCFPPALMLQSYTAKKQVETAYKSIRFGAGTASSVSPTVYAKRFCDFMANTVFYEA